MITKMVGLLLLLIIIFTGCTKKEVNIDFSDKEASKILDRAIKLLDNNENVKGIKLMEKIVKEHKDTKTYNRVIKYMNTEGLTPGNALYSYTSKKMIRMQNEILRFYNAHKKYPKHLVEKRIDAWGNKINHFATPGKIYDFLIVSKGSDINKDIDDLIIVGYFDKYSNSKKAKNIEEKDELVLDVTMINELGFAYGIKENSDGSIIANLEQINKIAQEEMESSNQELSMTLEEIEDMK